MADFWFRRLEQQADPVKAAGAQKYFKERVRCFGLSAPEIRAIAAEAYDMIKGAWTVHEAVGFCDIMVANPYLEAKALGILLLERFKNDYPKSLFSKIKGWLKDNYCNNWASVDTLCPISVGALLEKYPNLKSSVKTWARSPNRWVRRASLVSFIKLARKPIYLDSIYEVCESLFDDSDDLIQKASGWLLREAGKIDPVRLEKFLLAKGSTIPRTTLRYAIERFDQSKRKSLLTSTRNR